MRRSTTTSHTRVVAESCARADVDLILTVLEYALRGRGVAPGTLVHHADHSCRNTPIKLTTRLQRAGVASSAGSVGNSYDDALAEYLWSVVGTDCLRRRTFDTRADANHALFAYEERHYAEQAADLDDAAISRDGK